MDHINKFPLVTGMLGNTVKPTAWTARDHLVTEYNLKGPTMKTISVTKMQNIKTTRVAITVVAHYCLGGVLV